jgi:hypothetical protein
VAFARRSRRCLQIVGGAMTASSCCSPKLRRDLAVEQGQSNLPGGVMLLTKCELTDIASAPAARRLDHMIGRHCLQSQGPITREPSGAALRMLRQMSAGVKYAVVRQVPAAGT